MIRCRFSGRTLKPKIACFQLEQDPIRFLQARYPDFGRKIHSNAIPFELH